MLLEAGVWSFGRMLLPIDCRSQLGTPDSIRLFDETDGSVRALILDQGGAQLLFCFSTGLIEVPP